MSWIIVVLVFRLLLYSLVILVGIGILCRCSILVLGFWKEVSVNLKKNIICILSYNCLYMYVKVYL